MIQIFGTRKCQDTKKARRWFKERGIPVQFIDLDEKGISPGELGAVIRAVTVEGVIDRQGKRYGERGLEHMEFDPEEEMLADAGLLRTPIVRNGPKAACGGDAKAWEALAKGS
jgi:arsenate reductase